MKLVPCINNMSPASTGSSTTTTACSTMCKATSSLRLEHRLEVPPVARLSTGELLLQVACKQAQPASSMQQCRSSGSTTTAHQSCTADAAICCQLQPCSAHQHITHVQSLPSLHPPHATSHIAIPALGSAPAAPASLCQPHTASFSSLVTHCTARSCPLQHHVWRAGEVL
jgi:hypothetical protein